MNEDQTAAAAAPKRSARDWVQVLAQYRDPSSRRSVLELVATLVPFVLLWGLAWAALSVSYLLAFAIAAMPPISRTAGSRIGWGAGWGC